MNRLHQRLTSWLQATRQRRRPRASGRLWGAHESRVRAAISASCLTLALTLLVGSYLVPMAGAGVLLNLGTELLGIVITVSVIEFLLEQMRQGEQVESIAWNYLQLLDHAAWVWLGGNRSLDLGEVGALLAQVSSDDTLAGSTQNLLLRLASRAQTTLRTQSRLVNSAPRLKAGLVELGSLTSLRDDQGRVKEPRFLATKLLAASRSLTRLVSQEAAPERLLDLPQHLDSSHKMQRWRLFGRDWSQPTSSEGSLP